MYNKTDVLLYHIVVHQTMINLNKFKFVFYILLGSFYVYYTRNIVLLYFLG